MNLLSIDASLNSSGFAVWNDKKLGIKHVIQPDKKLDETEKRKYIQEKFRIIITSCKIDEVVLEDTFFSKNVKVLKQLMIVHGIIISICNDCNIPYAYYTPTAIKKNELGKCVKGAKKLIQEKMIELYELPNNTKDDITDAIALGRLHLGIK